MSLYPTTIIDPVTAAIDPNGIQPGSLVVIPIDMSGDVLMTKIDLQHVAGQQDYSLRAWISLYQNGNPLPSDVNYSGNYPIIRFSNYPIVLYVAGQTPPPNTFSILVEPKAYFLNILNLTNEVNAFGFTQTDISVLMPQ